jgi:hypothetical protein
MEQKKSGGRIFGVDVFGVQRDEHPHATWSFRQRRTADEQNGPYAAGGVDELDRAFGERLRRAVGSVAE